MSAAEKFVSDIEAEISDIVCTKLMDKIDTLVRKYDIADEDVVALLQRVDDSLALDEAWAECVE